MKNPYLVGLSVCVATISATVLVYDAVFRTEHIHFSAHGDSEGHNQHHQITTESSSDSGAKTFFSQQKVTPIPSDIEIDRALAKVGWLLFRDPNLSSNKNISCESCHDLQSNGAETNAVSIGVNGVGTRNSLTVFNAAYNYRFFWDGRANTLESQIDGPIHNTVEMDSNWPSITQYVSQTPQYQPLFSQLGLEINEQSIKASLVEFMRALTTPNSPFDSYIQGNEEAIGESAKKGWYAFQEEGCIRCHQGTNIGGGMVMRFGYFGLTKTGQERSEDQGRFMSTGKEMDKHLFRVASLRNVAITAPYFHDGQTHSLEEAIKIMGESQLGKTFEDDTVKHLKAFLETLTGQRPSILEAFENE
ncbi:cytochrome B6 [Vibrio pelagius]|uniref:Cytochrome B6 n=1 Tax=Vibrio pelagius TaxID=28169 RepID=A0ABY5G9S5_VIBPE|nr:cytochrome c peroxidase [Vibrio pelagius]UTT86942.1 cytochrome B6 [Vibrio pelagius]